MNNNGDKEEKTNIGYHLPVILVDAFRKHCIDVKRRPGELLAEIIEQYLEEEDVDPYDID